MPAKSQLKKLSPAAVEATATAFMAAFKALPGAVKGRVMELIDDYEDEAAAAQLAADKVANPADFDPKNSIPWEQVKAELDAERTHSGEQASQREAA